MKEQVDYCVSKNVGWKIQKECNNNCKLPVGICSMSNPPCGSQECIDNGLLGQFMCVAGSVEKMVSDDPCAVGPCSTDELCRVTDGEATCTKRSQLGACCEAFATCGADESMRESPCTQAELLSKSCYRNSICCNEVFCITESAKPAVFNNCASKPCPDGFVCSGGPESLTSSFVCTSKPTNCCEALPSCKDSDITSNTPCQQGETGCYREQMCCEEVFCRKPNKTHEMKPTAETNNCNNMCTSDEECVAVPNACPAMPCPPVHVCQQKETCGGKICVDGTVCTKNDDHCTNPLRCEPKLICDSRICCLAVAVCKEGYELSSSCSEDDYDSGECLWERMCCSSISCKKYAFLLINYSLVVVFVKLLIDVEYDTLQGSDGLSVVPRLSLLHF